MPHPRWCWGSGAAQSVPDEGEDFEEGRPWRGPPLQGRPPLQAALCETFPHRRPPVLRTVLKIWFRRGCLRLGISLGVGRLSDRLRTGAPARQTCCTAALLHKGGGKKGGRGQTDHTRRCAPSCSSGMRDAHRGPSGHFVLPQLPVGQALRGHAPRANPYSAVDFTNAIISCLPGECKTFGENLRVLSYWPLAP